MKSELLKAVHLLQAGEVVAFPTETVYGLGANAYNSEAIQKIYQLKGRPSTNPLIVHIAEMEDLKDLVTRIEPMEALLMTAFWPGPLTLVLPKTKRVPSETTGGLSTVALRMPAHTLALELIRKAGFPIAAPSANLSGKPSATHHKHVEDYFGEAVFCLSGGATEHGLESTVLQVKNGTPHIYRLGSITPEDIEEATGVKPILETRSPHSPGTHFKHYAPQTPLRILSKKQWLPTLKTALAEHQRVGVLSASEDQKTLERMGCTVYALGPKKQLLEWAAHLYNGLLELDKLHLDTIFVQELPEKGLGLALMDRLRRAAGLL